MLVNQRRWVTVPCASRYATIILPRTLSEPVQYLVSYNTVALNTCSAVQVNDAQKRNNRSPGNAPIGLLPHQHGRSKLASDVPIPLHHRLPNL